MIDHPAALTCGAFRQGSAGELLVLVAIILDSRLIRRLGLWHGNKFTTPRQLLLALEDVMNAALTTKTTDHWVEVLEAAGVPCGPVYDYAQMFADHDIAATVTKIERALKFARAQPTP